MSAKLLHSTAKEYTTTNIVSVYAVPLFFICVLIDCIFTFMKMKKKRVYRINDSINSISCGMMSELMKLHVRWLALLPYTYIYKNHAIYRASVDSPVAWVLVCLGIDLGYYLSHRATHVINFGWIAHATHHSSEYMNLTTAMRQSMFGHFFNFVFYLPLAFFFPPYLYTTHYAINVIYQFWIHNDVIGKLHPAFEFIFNTPSHHRVHHARNPQYIDKNYAGMFIIWDRMFGTFEEEREEPVYGLVHPLATWDVIWAQMHHVVAVFEEVYRVPGISNKIMTALAGPAWKLSKDGRTWVQHPIPAIDWKQEKYNPHVPSKLLWYTLFQFLITLALQGLVFTKYFRYLSFTLSVVITLYLVFCLEVYGLLLNRHRYSAHLEITRIIITFGMSLYIIAQFYVINETAQSWAVLAAGAYLGISMQIFEVIQREIKSGLAEKKVQ